MIAPEQNGAFVAAMEDVLEVYTRPEDPARPVVCMDETSKQLVRETRAPIAAVPATEEHGGRPERIDYEYERNGVANLFMLFEPLTGRRHVRVTQRRTKRDWALLIKELCDVIHPDAHKIVLVMDNLNTHAPASLYETFEPAEARRLLERLEIHYTPKHGSWLNMAEIELAIVSRQCLDRRIPDIETLKTEIEAWSALRLNQSGKVHWRFAAPDARIKLARLYPVIST